MPTIDTEAALDSLPPAIAVHLMTLPATIDSLASAVAADELTPEQAAADLGARFLPIFKAVHDA